MEINLTENIVYLVEHLTDLESVLLHLIQKRIITFHDAEFVKSWRTSIEKNTQLFELLRKKDFDKVGEDFVEILSKTGNQVCAEKLKTNTNNTNLKQQKGITLINNKKYEEAYVIFEEVVADKEQNGHETEDVLQSKLWLANAKKELGDTSEAQALYVEIYENLKDLLGENHSKTLSARICQAVLFFDQGNFEDALHIFQDDIKAKESILRCTDPSILKSKLWLADTLREMNRFQESMEICNESYSKLDESHPFASKFRKRIEHLEDISNSNDSLTQKLRRRFRNLF